MDWIDEIFDKFKKRIKNLSIRKAMAVYILIASVTVIILILITSRMCDSWENLIWNKYGDQITKKESYRGYYLVSQEDINLLKVLRIIDFWSGIVYSVIAIIIVAYIFYRDKLKEPILIITESAKHISRNDLSYSCNYENKDEMGALCGNFDKMRLQLIDNNKKMWDIMEEQRRLNGAFAHDLRTPLTVLHGYADFILKYYPEGKINENKLMDTVGLLLNQINRLESFSNTMKEVNSLDQIALKKANINSSILVKKIEDILNIINGTKGIEIKLINRIDKEVSMYIDENVVIEVMENLISNAVRYAENKIEITLDMNQDNNRLILYVSDDGRGFSEEDIRMATRPYYKDKESTYEHFGIGLYICKIICKKHGGDIEFMNSISGGAIVSTDFYVL